MSEALLRLSRGRNSLLSSILGELAVILGLYAINPFELDENYIDTVEKTKYYFRRAKEGFSLSSKQSKAGIGFDSLKSLNAMKEISLVWSDGEGIDKFFDEVNTTLEAMENNEEIGQVELIKLREFFIRLSKELAKPHYHPEASRRL